jgi:hypothetical protein
MEGSPQTLSDDNSPSIDGSGRADEPRRDPAGKLFTVFSAGIPESHSATSPTLLSFHNPNPHYILTSKLEASSIYHQRPLVIYRRCHSAYKSRRSVRQHMFLPKQITNNINIHKFNTSRYIYQTSNMSTSRSVIKAVYAQETPEGVGATVRRSIGTAALRNLSPFLM